MVTGIVGCAGLIPTIAAMKARKDIALANKDPSASLGHDTDPDLKRRGQTLGLGRKNSNSSSTSELDKTVSKNDSRRRPSSQAAP